MTNRTRNAPTAWLGAMTAVLSVLVIAPVGAGELTRADASDGSAVQLGEILYAEHCASCHGKSLEGEENWKQELPEGGRPAPPHDQSGHTWHHDDQLLFRITKLGPRAFDTGGYVYRMPAFERLLDDDEIWAVLAFIKSTWPNEAQAYQRQLNQNRGLE
jgi:mono/diheme cytochrome c family protein